MFTGLIEDCGSISSLTRTASEARLSVKTGLSTEDIRIGDSVAVNGACLTVISKEKTEFSVDMSPETFEKTTFAGLQIGSKVNLERALRVGDRLGGHIVTGHIDTVGFVQSVQRESNAIIIAVEITEDYSRYLVPKGSVAIDGISLTVNAVAAGKFSVSIIPHTLSATTLETCQAGDKVNIETDILGKYVERLLGHIDGQKQSSSLTSEFLAKHGFM